MLPQTKVREPAEIYKGSTWWRCDVVEPLICPSDEWLAAVKDAVNRSPEFRQLGKDIDIPVAIIMEPIPPEMGLREAFIFQIDARQGIIRQMNRIDRATADALPAVISGTYRR